MTGQFWANLGLAVVDWECSGVSESELYVSLIHANCLKFLKIVADPYLVFRNPVTNRS